MVRLFRHFLATLLLALTATWIASGQTGTPKATPNAPRPTPEKPKPTPTTKGIVKPTTGEQVGDFVLLFYSGGRGSLDQIRKTTSERGLTTVTSADGHKEQSKYERYVIRGETLGKEKVRLDRELPTAKFSLVRSEENVYGIYNNTVFPPREDARQGFENQIFHGIDALLRFRADGSTLGLGANEKILGVDYYVIDLTDKQGRKTRYYVSTKTYRVMMLTYEEGGVKYRRKFYDYNYAQGTLVPFRSVLWADEKIVEETEIGTITFGQKVDESLFRTT
jgi:hypothetical protein